MNNREYRKSKQQQSKGGAEMPVPASANEQEATSKLADFAHKQRQMDEAKAKAKGDKRLTSTAKLPPLPRMPKGPRKPKAGKPCECGCAEMTKGGRFIPGHDARLHAWALRVEKGLVKLNEVPAPHTEAVKRLMKAGGVSSTKKVEAADRGVAR